MNGKRFLITGDTVGYTELPKNAEAVSVNNSQVIFNGVAKNVADAVRQCRKIWKGYDLKGESLGVYKIANITSAEF